LEEYAPSAFKVKEYAKQGTSIKQAVSIPSKRQPTFHRLGSVIIQKRELFEVK
jgi:hypothetical protein